MMRLDGSTVEVRRDFTYAYVVGTGSFNMMIRNPHNPRSQT